MNRNRRRHNAQVAALRCSGLTAVLLMALAFVPTTGAGAATTGPIAGNVEPALDTVDPGTVGVAASGAPLRGVVPVVVQNRKPATVTHVRISARAVDGDGRTVARATTRTVVPEVLDPGALGLARVDFGDPLLPLGVSYKFVVTSKRGGSASPVTLEPTGFRLSPPMTGRVAQTLNVTLRNPTNTRARGPVRVAVMCFGESRRPVQYVADKAHVAQLAPGTTMNTTVEFDELCPAYVVGASTVSTR